MGFASGFSAGANAIEAGMRLHQSAEQLKLQKEKAKYEEEIRERERAQHKALKDATDPYAEFNASADGKFAQTGEGKGALDGTTTAQTMDGPPTPQAVQGAQDSEMGPVTAAAIAEQSFGKGIGEYKQRVTAAQQAAQQGDNTTATLKRQAVAMRKHGNVNAAADLEKQAAAFQKEGAGNAAQHLLTTGDVDGAFKMFQESGNMRFPPGTKPIAKQVMRKTATGEIPDYEVSVQLPDGTVQPVGSAMQMFYMAQSPEALRARNQAESTVGQRQQALDQGHQVAVRGLDQGDARIAQGDRQIGIQQQSADQQGRAIDNQYSLGRESNATSRFSAQSTARHQSLTAADAAARTRIHAQDVGSTIATRESNAKNDNQRVDLDRRRVELDEAFAPIKAEVQAMQANAAEANAVAAAAKANGGAGNLSTGLTTKDAGEIRKQIEQHIPEADGMLDPQGAERAQKMRLDASAAATRIVQLNKGSDIGKDMNALRIGTIAARVASGDLKPQPGIDKRTGQEVMVVIDGGVPIIVDRAPPKPAAVAPQNTPASPAQIAASRPRAGQ